MSATELLLRIEHLAAAKAIGFKSADPEDLITDENLYQIINDIELLSLASGNDKLISSLCGLLWTHFGPHYDLLGEYIYRMMARIGFSPVSSMLKSNDGRIKSSSFFPALEAELYTAAHTVNAMGVIYKLTGFQKELWEAIEHNDNVAVSAPTSAGKSFLICLNTIHGISKRGGISLYIVPNLTLMNQVANDLAAISVKHDVKVSIETHLPRETIPNTPTIYIATQERVGEFENFLNQDQEFRLNYFIIDEIQNIERAFDIEGSDIRSKLLLDVIIDVHDALNPIKTVVSGPRISEIELLSESLFHKDCHAVIAKSSPVANVCYSVAPYRGSSEKITLRQFSELQSQHSDLVFENTIGASGFGKKIYSDDFHKYLVNVLRDNPGSLVFSPTSGQCRKTALKLAASYENGNNAQIDSLSDYIRKTVSPNYDLAYCVERGISFHHGKMPHHVRNAIEFAVSESMFRHVVCTTTLMQGVNIPARNVVLRNPNLFVKQSGDVKAKLSNYEIANLRGRAGRLLRDFVGRTYILDGTSFEEVEAQESLFKPAHKSIDGSYAGIFTSNREEIMAAVGAADDSGRKNGLATYIASVIYTEPDPLATLSRKGIDLTRVELKSIQAIQRNLIIDPTICRRHRYWNPFDLDVLCRDLKSFALPRTPFSHGARDNLAKTLLRVQELLPHQFSHYLGKRNSSEAKIWVIAKHAVSWASETPLAKILREPYPMESSDNTDSTINLLQNGVSYGVPSLVSPLYDLIDPQAMMLGAVESGAHKSTTQQLISHNIPRETAIAVTSLVELHGRRLESFGKVVGFLQKVKLGYWDAIQFRHVIPIARLIS